MKKNRRCIILSILTAFFFFDAALSWAATAGSDFEQGMPVEGAAEPSVTIIADGYADTGQTFELAAYSDVDSANGASPSYYWYVSDGSISKHPGYSDYSVVNYTAPDTPGPVTAAVKVGDSLGKVAYDATVVEVAEETSSDPAPPVNGDCSYTPSPSGWQYIYHVAYLLTDERTSTGKPSGHLRVQPETNDMKWDYNGTVQAIVNGAPVVLYEDSDLTTALGKTVSYPAGGTGFEFWFDSDFAASKAITVSQLEVGYDSWEVVWMMKADCPVQGPDPGKPDLKVDSPEIEPNLAKPGDVVNTRFRVENIGPGWAEPSAVAYYLSTNGASYDDSDMLLRQDQVGVLISGGSSIHEFSVVIPETVSPGDHHIVFVADAANVLDEENEDNNQGFVAISVKDGADLAPLNPSVSPGTVTAGNSVTAQFDLRNMGSVSTAGSSRVGYYLSEGNTDLDPADTLLGTDYFGFMLPDGQQHFSRSLKIPAGTSGGKHYILFSADYTNVLPETNEENNVAYAAITVNAAASAGQDAVIENPVLESATVVSGEYLDFECKVKNIGTEYLRSTNLGYYWSEDDKWDASDKFDYYSRIDALQPGLSDEIKGATKADKSYGLGHFYIILYADYENTQSESNENNNWVALPVQVVQPDIAATLTLEKSEVSSGSALDAVVQVKNIGDGAFETGYNMDFAFYLSKDKSKDGADYFIHQFNSSQGFKPNETRTFAETLSVYGSIPPGDYYMLFIADFYEVCDEQSETNNTIAVPLKVTAANSAPAVDPVDPRTASQDKVFTLSFAFSDPDADDTHMAQIDWSDGSPMSQCVVDSQNGTAAASHAYSDSGEFTAVLTVIDDKGGSATGAALVTVLEADSDGDGVVDSQDRFPDDPYEWADFDNDGIGDNGDEDDDNDGMTDSLEKQYEQYGLDPCDPSDADEDLDGDGYTNREEAEMGTDLSDPNSPSAEVEQAIELEEGWNLISLYVAPEDPSLPSVFDSVMDSLVQVKNTTESYDPAAPDFLNTLAEMEVGGGYWVNVEFPCTLIVAGLPADPSQVSIELDEGWNLVGMPLSEEIALETALGYIMDVLVQAKDTSLSYDPLAPVFLNTLTMLSPGSGYWINVESYAILVFPSAP